MEYKVVFLFYKQDAADGDNKEDILASPATPVHFYAQLETPFSSPNSPIVFTSAPVNVGGAFRVATGVFTAEDPGIYRFSFSGIKDLYSVALTVILRHTTLSGVTDVAEAFCTGLSGAYTSCSLEAMIKMEAGDTVYLFNSGYGVLYDGVKHVTQFSGSFLDETTEL